MGCLRFLMVVYFLPVAALFSQVHFESAVVGTNRDFNLKVSSAETSFFRIDRSSDLTGWQPLATLRAAASNEFSDTAAAYRSNGYYRGVHVDQTNTVTGDHLMTAEGVLTIHPVNHASFVMTWNGLTIYNDPVGGAALYNGLPRADLILVSHEHGDHFESATLSAVRRTDQTNTIILAPRNVYNGMSTTLKALTTVLTNGTSTNVLGILVEAVPAYNSNHPKGAGNGYVVTLGGKRLYMSGDTGNINEMKTLADIDVAFICMNVPYTMNVAQAAAIVREFKPAVVYPYHFRNQNGTFADLNAFRQQVGNDLGIEVRARKWY